MSQAMCSFSGGTIIAYCERGCCGSSCCSTTSTTGGGVTYALIGVIAALIFIFLVMVAVYLVLRRKGYCRSRPDAKMSEPWRPPPPKDKKGKKHPHGVKKVKKIKKGQIIALNAFDWHGKKKEVQQDSKDTQTDNFKCLPGDFIKWTNGFWLPVKRDKNAPKDERQNIRDIGVNTDAIKNNARSINVEPKINNTEVVPKAQQVVQKVNTAAVVKPFPGPKEVKPVHTRAVPVVPTEKPPNADYREVKLPYDTLDISSRQPRSTEYLRPSLNSSKPDDSSAKSVSFGPTPEPAESTPRNASRQDTIELLNEFSRQMMNQK